MGGYRCISRKLIFDGEELLSVGNAGSRNGQDVEVGELDVSGL